jgi:SpoIIAA-like
MITIEKTVGNLIKIKVPEHLHAGDFTAFASQADALIAQHREVRLLLDARQFQGWENLEVAEEHFRFVKVHQNYVKRIAIVAGHRWQHCLAGIANTFMHPDIRVFDNESAAEVWING